MNVNIIYISKFQKKKKRNSKFLVKLMVVNSYLDPLI